MFYQESEIGNYANTYHSFAVAWSPTKIIWYVDGNPIRIANNHRIVDEVAIILNFDIGTGGNRPDCTTPFPSVMQVAYIKVHELRNDCSNNVSTCNFNFTSIDPA